MTESSTQSRHYQCPRCGSRLAHDKRTGIGGLLTGLIFLRSYRCAHECGWRGLRFSRSLFRARSRRLRVAAIVVLFVVVAAASVYFMLSRAGLRAGGSHDDSAE